MQHLRTAASASAAHHSTCLGHSTIGQVAVAFVACLDPFAIDPSDLDPFGPFLDCLAAAVA